jgi:hypothetical protein
MRAMGSPTAQLRGVGNSPTHQRGSIAGREPRGDLMRPRSRVARKSMTGRVEVQHDEMTFFTHRVNGQTYGAWYRQLAPRELEIIGAGFMCKTPYAGCDELSVARSVLEDYLRGQIQIGARPQSLDSCEQR